METLPSKETVLAEFNKAFPPEDKLKELTPSDVRYLTPAVEIDHSKNSTFKFFDGGRAISTKNLRLHIFTVVSKKLKFDKTGGLLCRSRDSSKPDSDIPDENKGGVNCSECKYTKPKTEYIDKDDEKSHLCQQKTFLYTVFYYENPDTMQWVLHPKIHIISLPYTSRRAFLQFSHNALQSTPVQAVLTTAQVVSKSNKRGEDYGQIEFSRYRGLDFKKPEDLKLLQAAVFNAKHYKPIINDDEQGIQDMLRKEMDLRNGNKPSSETNSSEETGERDYAPSDEHDHQAEMEAQEQEAAQRDIELAEQQQQQNDGIEDLT